MKRRAIARPSQGIEDTSQAAQAASHAPGSSIYSASMAAQSNFSHPLPASSFYGDDEDDEFDLAPAGTGAGVAAASFAAGARNSGSGDGGAPGASYAGSAAGTSSATMTASTAASVSTAAGLGTLALQVGAGSSSAVMAVIPRPVALTKHGIRQYVETSSGLRLFLQCVQLLSCPCEQ